MVIQSLRILRSFHNPNFRHYFIGQAISMLGTFIQFGAIPWVVWELTHSAWWLGASQFANQIPLLVLGLFGGVLADRISRRRLIAITQSLLLLQALVLAVLSFSQALTLAPLIVLITISGIINAADFPARQAFTMDLVGPKNLGNGIALNAGLVHTMRVIGPMLAGWILHLYGAGVCFVVNAATYLAILFELARINVKSLHPQPIAPQHLLHALHEGFHIIRSTPGLRRPLTLLAVLSLLAGGYMAFLPYYADQVFGRGAEMLGYLMGTSAAGALTGAILLARVHQPNLERWILWGASLLAVGLTVFAHSQLLWLSYLTLYAVGIGMFCLISCTNTLVQLRSPHHARARIVSYLTSAFFGLAPVGSFIIGNLAAHMGVPWALSAGSIASLVVIVGYRIGARHQR